MDNDLESDDIKYSSRSGQILLDKSILIDMILKDTPKKLDFYHDIFIDSEEQCLGNENAYFCEIQLSIEYDNDRFITLFFNPLISSIDFDIGINDFEVSLCGNYDDFQEDIFQVNHNVREKLLSYVSFLDITNSIKKDIINKINIIE